MKRKNVCGILLSLCCLFLSGCSDCGTGIQLYDDGIFIYTISKDDNSVAIYGLTDKGKEQEYLVFPKEIDNKTVVRIGCITGLHITAIEENDGNVEYAQFKSEKLKKVFYNTTAVVRQYEPDNSSPFADCPNLITSIKINEELNPPQWADIDIGIYWRKEQALDILHTANVSYYYNYDNAPNGGYYWLDDYDGTIIEYIPSNPEREGYTFDGWYKEPECINEWAFATDVVPSKVFLNDTVSVENYQYLETALYAKWIKK